MDSSVNKQMVNEFERSNLKVPNLSFETKYWYIASEKNSNNFIFFDPLNSSFSISNGLYSLFFSPNFEREYKNRFNKIQVNDIILYFSEIYKIIYVLKVNKKINKKNYNLSEDTFKFHVSILRTIHWGELGSKLASHILWSDTLFLNISKYANTIDSIIHSIYIKGDQVVLNIDTRQNEILKTETLKNLIDLPWIVRDLIEEESYDLSELRSTICIQSPGRIQFLSKGEKDANFIKHFLIILIAAASFTGGSISVSKDHIDAELNGFIPQVTKLLEEYNRFKESEKSVENKHNEKVSEKQYDAAYKIINLKKETKFYIQGMDHYYTNDK